MENNTVEAVLTDWLEFSRADANKKILIKKDSIESIQEVQSSNNIVMLTTKSGMSYDINGSYIEIMERL